MAIERSEMKWIQPLLDPEEKCPALVLLTPIDLQMSNMHIPMILSFPDASAAAEATMETGLSRVLAHYLEMAGRLGSDEGGRQCIHLSNDGVPLLLAKSPHKMDEFLEQGKHDHLGDLLASSSLPGTSLPQVPLLVQITRFACGGLTLGLERHHHVVDGTGNAKFILDWASCSKLEEESFVPVAVIHDRPWLMPRQPPQVEFDHPEYRPPAQKLKIARDSATTVSITFDPEELAFLKSLCGSSQQQYSTFVSLSAHLWRSITSARKLRDDVTTCFVCPVDGRRFLGTPAGFFGNAVFRGFAHSLSHDLLKKPLSHAAALVHAGVKSTAREARMRSVVDYLSGVQRSSTSSLVASSLEDNAIPSFAPNMVASSWSRFTLYDADFGFGCPTSLSTTGIWTDGTVIIAPSSRKDGSLEVFVTLLKEQVHDFLLLLGKQ